MAKTEEQHREAVIKQVGRRVVGGGWKWRGTEFVSWGYCEGGKWTGASVHFTANYNCIRVEIEEEEYYNLPNPVETFRGDDALTEAVIWTADKLIELDKIVTARTAKYEAQREIAVNNCNMARKGLL